MSRQTPSSQHTRLKDFSVESQRRNFVAEQERERAAAEILRSSRKIAKATSSAKGDAIKLSGMMRRLDDDDSLDSCSVGSEESFYVGIDRADYTHPDNLEMYGDYAEKLEEREDRLGIGRVKVEIGNWEDEVVPVHEEMSSLYQFMTGSNDDGGHVKQKKDVLVAMPLVVDGILYRRGNVVEEDHSQVYQQEAAEGKMFINKLVSGAALDTVTDVVNVPAATPAKPHINTPFTTPGTQKTVREGQYPTISPMALFSPYVNAVSEDNATRQLREREIRRDADAEAKREFVEKVKKLQDLVKSFDGDNVSLEVLELKRQMDGILKGE